VALKQVGEGEGLPCRHGLIVIFGSPWNRWV